MSKLFIKSGFFVALAAALLPAFAGAITFLDTLNTINRFLNAFIPLFITLAIVYFFWGLAKYMLNIGEKKDDAIQAMIWGIVGLFVMVSIWGIIKLLQNTFKVGDTNPIVPRAIEISDTFQR